MVLRTRTRGPVKVNLPVTLPQGKTYGRAADGKPQLKSAEGAHDLVRRALPVKDGSNDRCEPLSRTDDSGEIPA